MKKILGIRVLKICFTVALILLTSIACNARLTGNEAAELQNTISAQSTWIAHLSTQVGKQEQTNINQEKNISHLYTQMPYALGWITPIPPDMTITPTAYSLDDQVPDAHFTPTPSLSIDIEYPPEARTGIDEIDNIIDIISSEDIDARLKLTRLTTTACTTADGLGGPPKCQPDEADGTIVDAFPVSNLEGYHVRPDQIQTIFNFSVRGLAAVYVVPEDAYDTEYWPAGKYGIVFTSEDDGHPHVITVVVEEGQIVRLSFFPGWPPFDYIWQKSDTFLLPPMR